MNPIMMDKSHSLAFYFLCLSDYFKGRCLCVQFVKEEQLSLNVDAVCIFVLWACWSVPKPFLSGCSALALHTVGTSIPRYYGEFAVETKAAFGPKLKFLGYMQAKKRKCKFLLLSRLWSVAKKCRELFSVIITKTPVLCLGLKLCIIIASNQS